MADNKNLPHFFVENVSRSSAYKGRGFGNKNTPERNATQHGKRLKDEFEQAWEQAEAKTNEFSSPDGLYLEFRSKAGFDLVYDSLADVRNRVEVRYVRSEFSNTEKNTESVVVSSVFVPIESRNWFLSKLNKYINESPSSISGKLKNQDLINSIEEIRCAVSKSFWTDFEQLFPDDNEKRNCEVWISADQELEIKNFGGLLTKLNIKTIGKPINFVGRTVFAVKASKLDLDKLLHSSSYIAEFRSLQQMDWMYTQKIFEAKDIKDYLNSVSISIENRSNIFVCVLDSGIAIAHPLLKDICSVDRFDAIDDSWSKVDIDSEHGTQMAGIVAFESVQRLLDDGKPVIVPFELESVRFIAPKDQLLDRFFARDFMDAISKSNIINPIGKKVYCLAFALRDSFDSEGNIDILLDEETGRALNKLYGRPSSFSATIDQSTFGEADGLGSKLVLLAAGNALIDSSELHYRNYPESIASSSIHTPGQSWNAIAVGALTSMDKLSKEWSNNYEPISRLNQISPFSTSSAIWYKGWPCKPDIVMSGGNIVRSKNGFIYDTLDEVSHLTTSANFVNGSYLSTIVATSLATAEASNFAAKLWAEYPNSRPETIRALMIHSARWPDPAIIQLGGLSNKKNIGFIMSHIGYGKPDYSRA